ncbi:MAG: DUF1648 domain-containing protein [Solobacterium sp.]|nr:DUF1648 domain-containing protein [Solobacterium sp.]
MNKLKTERITVIFTTLLCFIPMIAGILLWNALPDQIPSHFNFSGAVDGYSGKGFIVFGFPLMMVGVQLLCAVGTAYDPKEEGVSNRIYRAILWIVPITTLIVFAGIYGFVFHVGPDINLLVRVMMGILFIFFGNYMPKVRQNTTVGIKIPWTIHDAENWNRTHRLAGYLYLMCGFVILFGIFLPEDIAVKSMIIAIVVTAVFPIIYSFQIYRKSL